MPGLSKSRYTTFCQCSKALWLRVYHPELQPEDPNLQARFDAGNEVGDLAMGLRSSLAWRFFLVIKDGKWGIVNNQHDVLVPFE